jgi:hypothetical protein
VIRYWTLVSYPGWRAARQTFDPPLQRGSALTFPTPSGRIGARWAESYRRWEAHIVPVRESVESRPVIPWPIPPHPEADGERLLCYLCSHGVGMRRDVGYVVWARPPSSRPSRTRWWR